MYGLCGVYIELVQIDVGLHRVWGLVPRLFRSPL